MFFGRREKAEPLPLDSLQGLLDSLFGKRMEPLESKASLITRELRAAQEQFSKACAEFERLDAEPYTDDIWMPNVNAIKSQKVQYAAALTEIAGSLDLRAERTADTYSRYRGILSSVEEMTNAALRTNSKFKQSFYCYSRHLGGFKRSSAYFDRLTSALRSELEKRSPEFDRYVRLSEKISRLKAYGQEIEALSSAIASLKSAPKAPDDGTAQKTEAETRKLLANKAAELADASAEMTRLENTISLLTAPLERPSKKLDHLTLRKKPLHRFIEDPIGAIRDEAEYRDFTDLVQELKKNVDSGSIDSKNRQELSNSISALLNCDIYYMISSLKSLERKKLDIMSEERELERILEELDAGRENASKSRHQIERMENDLKAISDSRESLKLEIEGEFRAAYSRPVSIML